MRILKAHFKYFKYIFWHKWYVFRECCYFYIPINGLLHDLSKFYPSEWFPYVEYFYLNDQKDSIDFDLAWNYHQKRNPHHWQYWVLSEDNGNVKVLEMPLKYRKEMMADWIGVSRTFGKKIKDTFNWYQLNKDIIKLGTETRVYVEDMLLKRVHEEEFQEAFNEHR